MTRGEMRRQDRLMEKEELQCFLKERQVGSLGVNGSDGFPYVVPMNYCYVEDVFILHSGPQGEKIECLRADKKVCFSVYNCNGIVAGEEPCSYSVRYRSVTAFGKAEFPEGNEKRMWLEKFVSVFTGSGLKLKDEDVHRTKVIVLKPEAITGRKR